MANLSECLHNLALNFVNFAIPMLIQSSILIVLLLLLTYILRKKVTAIFLYSLWMLLLVKLVSPVSLTAPFSIGGLWSQYHKAVSIEIQFPDLPSNPISAPPLSPNNNTTVNNTATEPLPTSKIQETALPTQPHSFNSIAWQDIIFLIWLTAAIAMILLLIQRVLFVKGLIAQASNSPSSTQDLLNDCCKQMGLNQKIRLKLSPNTTSPAVCGLLNPVILLPHNLDSQLKPNQLKLVLMHELSHVRRGDLWINLTQTLLQIVYFYHPLLWLANAAIRRIREQAVDESVMATINDTAEAYPEALLHVAKLAFGRPSLGLRLVGVVEDKKAFKGRMKHMLNRPIPKSARISGFGIVMILAMGCFILPMARATDQSPTPPVENLESNSSSRPVQPQPTNRHTEGNPLIANDTPEVQTSPTEKINLQELINAARPRDVVTIPAGLYTEPITIDKSLTLRGESASDCILQVTDNEPAIWVDNKGKGLVTLENITVEWQLATSDKAENPCAILFNDTRGKASHCTITALGNYQRCPSGLRAQGFSNVTVEDCRLQGFEYVVQFMQGTQGVLQDSIIQDCGHQGVINYSDSTMKVFRNVITGSKYHAIRSTGGTLQVEDNLIINNQNRGIYLGNKSCRGAIRNNAIIGNGTGIDGFAKASVQIQNNLIMKNDYAGIGSRSTCSLSIKNNIITENSRGIIVFLQEGETRHRLRIGLNAVGNNETNTENCEIANGSFSDAMEFTDADNGDFSLTPGPAQEQGYGLKDATIIQALWQRWIPIRDRQ